VAERAEQELFAEPLELAGGPGQQAAKVLKQRVLSAETSAWAFS